MHGKRLTEVVGFHWDAIKAYINYLEAKNVKMRSLDFRAYGLRKFLLAMGPLRANKATKEQLIEIVARINKSKFSKRLGGKKDLSIRTRAEILATMKSFYKHYLGNDEFYPPQIAWLKSEKATRELVKEDLLTEKEVIKMISTAKTLRDKAIIAVLYETGARVGELKDIRLKDISFDTIPVHVKLNGKTGLRSVGIVTSVPYLKTYIESRKELKPDDIIWRHEGHYAHYSDNKGHIIADYAPIDYDTIFCVLKEVGRDAGITKRVNPHSFRHSRVTFMANIMTDQQLKKYFGWTPRSDMTSIYVHLADNDTDNAVLKLSGKEVTENVEESILKTWMCSVCGVENGVETQFCHTCKNPKNIIAETTIESQIAKMNEKLEQMSKLLALEYKNAIDKSRLDEVETFREMQDEEEAAEIKKMVKAHNKEARK